MATATITGTATGMSEEQSAASFQQSASRVQGWWWTAEVDLGVMAFDILANPG